MKAIYLLFFFIAVSTSFGHNSLRGPIIYVYEASVFTIQPRNTDVMDFAKGFFEGIGGTQIFNEIQSCLVDSEQVLLDLGIGIQDIQTKNPEKVKEGIHKIGHAVEIIPNAAKLCQVADKDIQKIIKIVYTFAHPISLLYRAEKSLIINHVEVFQEIMHAIEAYQKQDYTELGYWVGKAMIAIFVKNAEEIQDTRSDTIDFVEGFLDGIGTTNVFTEIQGCLVDSEQTLIELGIGIQYLESGNPERIREGIRIIGKVSKIIPQTAKDCKAADADIKKIIKFIRTFTHPISIIFQAGRTLKIDWVEVFNETMGAINAYKEQDYKDLGYWIGRAMATIFLKSPLNLRDAAADISDFVGGFSEGAGDSVTFDQVKEDPLSFLYDAGMRLITNQQDLVTGVNKVAAAYQDENFSQLGYWIGKTMETILKGKDNQEKHPEKLKALGYL